MSLLPSRFSCIPFDVPFRPQRNTRRPVVEGVQTAIVVGPKGQEIYTDEHGRVKVQFHWDREGKRDENSSCWIRVSQNWAGTGWGAMIIPRIGHEVIVDFEEGDPDRPLITGRVYHGVNKPPYKLPDEKTKSTVKTNSSEGGEGFNEIRFEDKKGEEQIFIHSEKNFDLRIKNDSFETVSNNRHLHVEKDKFEQVDNNRSETVDADHKEQIGKDRHLDVKGKEAKQVGGSLSLTVKGDVIEAFKANHSEQTGKDYYLKAQNIVIDGMTNITLSVGSSYIAIESGSIEIKTGGQIKIDGSQVSISGSGMTEIKGGMVKIN
jgi:type VI secretion system secreted protein VgrG